MAFLLNRDVSFSLVLRSVYWTGQRSVRYGAISLRRPGFELAQTYAYQLLLSSEDAVVEHGGETLGAGFAGSATSTESC